MLKIDRDVRCGLKPAQACADYSSYWGTSTCLFGQKPSRRNKADVTTESFSLCCCCLSHCFYCLKLQLLTSDMMCQRRELEKRGYLSNRPSAPIHSWTTPVKTDSGLPTGVQRLTNTGMCEPCCMWDTAQSRSSRGRKYQFSCRIL